MEHGAEVGGQKSEIRRQRTSVFALRATPRQGGQKAEVLSSHRASRHMAVLSLGHYASLSFIVIGRGQRAEGRLVNQLIIHSIAIP